MLTQKQAVQQVVEGTREQLRGIRAKVGKPLAVVWKWGGYGDFYFLTALAQAVVRHWEDRAHAVILCSLKGSTADIDLTAGLSGMPVDVLLPPPIPMWDMNRVLCEETEVVYHCPGYAVKRYTKAGFDDDGQSCADDCLRPWADFYFDWPEANHRLGPTGKTQWEMSQATSGLRVLARDMAVSARLASIPTDLMTYSMVHEHAVGVPSRARLRGVGDYVVVHNTPGGRGTTKQMPPERMQQAIDMLNDFGLRAVQVGMRDEKKYKHVIDRRGLRWPLTVALMAGAESYLGIEGALAYVAYAADKPAEVAFGPTPEHFFKFHGHMPFCKQECEPCWWSTADWFKRCPKGHKWCQNMPDAAQVEAALTRVYRHRKRKVA